MHRVIQVPTRPPQSAEEAVVACEPLVAMLANSYYAPGLDRDDSLQAGRVGVWQAWRDWRAETKVPWGSFVKLCVERQMITALKTARRRKHGPLSEAVSFHAPVGDEDGATLAEVIPMPAADPAHRVVAREELRRLLWAVDSLSDTEQAAVAGKFAGLTYDEIADNIAARRKTVDNALQRAWRKLAEEERGASAAAQGGGRALAYVPRRERGTPYGAPTADRAIEAARRRLGSEFMTARVVECAKRALSPDGQERRDTRGHPRADGRRPIAVWRVVLQASDVPARLAA